MAFIDDNKASFADGSDIKNREHVTSMLQMLIGPAGEGDECDGCGSQVASSQGSGNDPAQSISWSDQPGTPFSCGSTSSEEDWIKRNHRRLNVMQIRDEVGRLSDYVTQNYSPREAERLREIYETYDHPPFAAEAYAFALLSKKDFKSSAAWILKAASQGAPGAAELVFHIFGQVHEFEGIPLPETSKPILQVVEECLDIAVQGGIDSAKLHLAMLWISPEGMPKALERASGFKDQEGLQLLNRLSSDFRNENQAAIAALQKAVADREAQLKVAAELEHVKSSEVARQDAARFGELCGSIRIKGLCWEQSIEQMKTVMLARGYKCAEAPWIQDVKFECKIDGAAIMIKEEELEYTCANFNACGHTSIELAQMLIQQGYINEAKQERESFHRSNQMFVIDSYCGRGAGGDKLCVNDINASSSRKEITVTLSKGTLGSKGVSFD